LKISKEIKTAILVISSILLFIWGYSFLKGKDILENYKTVYVLYDSVEGLTSSAIVTFNGLNIGKVEKITYQEDTHKLKVQLQLKGSINISKTSKAVIYEPGFIGGKQIMIVPDYTNNEKVENDDFLIGEEKPGLTSELSQKLVPLQQKMESVLANMDAMLINVNATLDPKTQKNIQSSVEHLNTVLQDFAVVTKQINGLIADNKQKINHSMANLEKTTANFSKISDTLAKAELGKTIQTLEKTLANANSILDGINKGEGSMGKLMKDEKLYQNMEGATKELELLLRDMKLNPKRYVHFSLFGKKPKEYQETTSEK